MRARCLLLALLLAGCQSPRATLHVQSNILLPAPAIATPKPVPAPHDLVVALEPGTKPAALLAEPAASGMTLLGQVPLAGRLLVKIGVPDGMTVQEAQKRLSGLKEIVHAAPDDALRPSAYQFTRQDPDFAVQWAHQAIHADTIDAWSQVGASAQHKIIVAVLDTGLDVTHPEFAGRVVAPQNFATGGAPTTDVTDTVGHGTHVTGIVGAAGDNGIGVAGVAWGVQLMPVKVIGDQATAFDAIAGFLYAIRYRPNPDDGSRVRVVNMSFGDTTAGVEADWTDAIAEARQDGVVVVAAAGNDGRDVVASPANTPFALAVGATQNYVGWETLATFSDFGPRVDLVAPGVDIESTFPMAGSDQGAQYGLDSGTSMASPFVAGVAALVMAKYDPNNQQANATFADKVRARLIAATDDLGTPGTDPIYGAGRINAARAVTPATIDAAP